MIGDFPWPIFGGILSVSNWTTRMLGLTVMVAEALAPRLVTVTLVTPDLSAKTRPSCETVATVGLELVQTGAGADALPRLAAMVAVRRSDWSTRIVSTLLDNAIGEDADGGSVGAAETPAGPLASVPLHPATTNESEAIATIMAAPPNRW